MIDIMADLILTRAIATRARTKRDHLVAPQETDAPLGNWYVTYLPMAERNAFVYMSSRTQLSFLMPEGERRGRAMGGYQSVALARASDLSMLGVLTNCALDYEAFIAQDGGLKRCSLDRLVIEMNSRPAKKPGFATPLEATAAALGVS